MTNAAVNGNDKGLRGKLLMAVSGGGGGRENAIVADRFFIVAEVLFDCRNTLFDCRKWVYGLVQKL
jgi:hypothetical protein